MIIMKSIQMQKNGKDARSKIFEQNWEIVAVNYQSLKLKLEHGSGEAWLLLNGGDGNFIIDFLTMEAIENAQVSIKVGARTTDFTNMNPTVSSGSTVDENTGDVAPFELTTGRIYELDELKEFPLWIKPSEKLYFPYTCNNAGSYNYIKVHARVLMIQPISESKEVQFNDPNLTPLDAMHLFAEERRNQKTAVQYEGDEDEPILKETGLKSLKRLLGRAEA